MHETFQKLSNRMVGAMMIHTQLTELFNFIDLKSDTAPFTNETVQSLGWSYEFIF